MVPSGWKVDFNDGDHWMALAMLTALYSREERALNSSRRDDHLIYRHMSALLLYHQQPHYKTTHFHLRRQDLVGGA